jgi:hypothetical protein
MCRWQLGRQAGIRRQPLCTPSASARGCQPRPVGRIAGMTEGRQSSMVSPKLSGMRAVRTRKSSRCRGLLRRARVHIEPNRRVEGISSTDARSCVQLRSLLRLSVSEAMRQSAGWPRAASTQPDLPRPGPRGRQGRPAAHPPSPPRAETANRAWQADPVAVAEDRSAAGVRARREPEPAVIVVTLVRAGSVRHRKPLVLGGHERSRPANQNRRHTPSTATTSAGEAAWRRVRTPPLTAARLFGCLPRGSWSPESGLIVRPSWWLSPPHRAKFVLSGSALGKGEGGPAGAGVTR